jgi:radical SAM protein with 4Fe4S-binding SPASM domain
VLGIAEDVGVDELQVQTHLDWGKPPSEDEPPEGCGMTPAEVEDARRLVLDAVATASRIKVLLPFPTEGPVVDPALRPGRCEWPFNATWITADGAVTPCCNLHDPRQIRFGDAFRDSLETIWLGEAYEEFRARYRADAVPECRSCPVHYGRFKTYAYERSDR